MFANFGVGWMLARCRGGWQSARCFFLLGISCCSDTVLSRPLAPFVKELSAKLTEVLPLPFCIFPGCARGSRFRLRASFFWIGVHYTNKCNSTPIGSGSVLE